MWPERTCCSLYAETVTSTTRLLSLFAAGALALGLSACASTGSGSPTASPAATEDATSSLTMSGACASDAGVTFTVDSSALAGGSSESWCYVTTEKVAVADIVAATGVEIEGTKQYGDQVVCRVNGLPSASEPVGSTQDAAYVEKCDSMPAAFAYWALWTQPAGGQWDYAQEGVSTLTAQPGESVELLFTLDGVPAAPAA